MNKKYKNLTIDDIHEIRKENSKNFERMSNNDICIYIKKEAEAFLNNVKEDDAVLV